MATENMILPVDSTPPSNAADQKALADLETYLGRRLREVPLDKVLEHAYRGSYALDEKGCVAGLNLSPYFLEIDTPNLKAFEFLTSLSLRNTKLEDYSFLSRLAQLVSIDLSRTSVSDISFLALLPNLRFLSLSQTSSTDADRLFSALSIQESKPLGITCWAPLLELKKLTGLDLSFNSIQNADFLGQLTELKELNLTENNIDNTEFLINLTKLEKLYLAGSNIRDTSFLRKLSYLTTLEIGNNYLVPELKLPHPEKIETLALSNYHFDDLSFLLEYSNLRVLDLQSCSINNLSNLLQLKTLRSLNLSFVRIIDTSILAELTWLNTLYMGHVRVTDWSFISNLTKLTSLYLWMNQISDGAIFQPLRNLESLHLANNNIESLDFLTSLSNLRSLHLANNITLSSVENIDLTKLSELDLSNTHLESWDFLDKLSKLQVLSLSNNNYSFNIANLLKKNSFLFRLDIGENNIKSLPAKTLRATRLPVVWGHLSDGICIRGISLTSPSPELVQQGTQAVWDFFDSFTEDEKIRYLNEAKILLVGQGNVGKTSLVKRLRHEAFDPREPKTEGINILEWKLPSDDDEIQLNIWDFGGQEIVHATHQFFLTKRSLYILVINARQSEEENRLEYWLKIIQSYGAESPILIVGNQIDEHPLDLNTSELKAKYPAITEFIGVSCKTNEGIDNLRTIITAQVNKLPHVKDKFPESWFNIKKQLTKSKKDYISLDKFRAICRKNKVKDEGKQNTLMAYLHDLGIALNYNDDPRISDTNILNPDWVTGAVYKILNNHQLFHKKGILALTEMPTILDPKKYPLDKHLFVIEIMQKFELCFELDNRDSFLIPDLLPKEQSYTGEWDTALAFQFKYDVLPGSIISRLIVRMHASIHEKTYWRTGVVLEDNGNTALIKADLVARVIYISVKGPQFTRRPFLSAIRSQLKSINATISKLEAKEVVPIPGHPGITVPYDHLINLERLQIKTFVPEGLSKEIEVENLLEGVEHVRRVYLPSSSTQNGEIHFGPLIPIPEPIPIIHSESKQLVALKKRAKKHANRWMTILISTFVLLVSGFIYYSESLGISKMKPYKDYASLIVLVIGIIFSAITRKKFTTTAVSEYFESRKLKKLAKEFDLEFELEKTKELTV